MEEFIIKWQTLIGSAIGPFLAVVFSAIGFWIKAILEKKNKRKECLRRIEIGITRSLEDTIKTRIKLQDFALRLRTLITTIESVQDPNHFSIETINYPTMRDIYRDTDAPGFKVKSYYLHNKLLWADAGIKEMNETIMSLKNDFAELRRMNELNIALISQKSTPNPLQQRTEYTASLQSFASAIDSFVEKFINQGIEIMTQVKIYNEHLRKRNGFWFLWKNEGTKLKYFRNKRNKKNLLRILIHSNALIKLLMMRFDH